MSGIREIYWLDPLHFFYCLTAIVFLYMIFSKWFETRSLKNRLVLALDRATYQIFLVHYMAILISDSFFSQFGLQRMSVQYLLRIVTVFPVALGACLLWDFLKRQAKKLRKKYVGAKK